MSLLLFDCFEEMHAICAGFISEWEGRIPHAALADSVLNAVAWWRYMGLPEKDSLRDFVLEYADSTSLSAIRESVGMDSFVDALWECVGKGIRQ